MRTQQTTPNAVQEEKNKQEACLYEWLTRCVLHRKTICFPMARAIYYHVRRTREIFVVDFRASNRGVPLQTSDGDSVTHDEPIISLVSMPYPQFSLSAHDSIQEAVEVAGALGLTPRIHVYAIPQDKH